MPGEEFELLCPDCERLHRISSGGGIDLEGNPFYMESWCCRPCGRMFSLSSPSTSNSAPTCFTCGRRATRWPGEVRLEDPEDPDNCRVLIRGPCPACDRQLSERDKTTYMCLWD